MSDAAFLGALESCSLPASEFDHGAHVRAAYLYLRQGDFAVGLQRLRSAIRRYATNLGKPERYHETVTVAFAALIHRHLVERGDAGGWLEFRCRNPELLERRLLLEFYSEDELSSPLAREIFVLPGSQRPGAALPVALPVAESDSTAAS